MGSFWSDFNSLNTIKSIIVSDLLHQHAYDIYVKK